MAILLDITCLCGGAAQTLTARPPPEAGDGPIPISICHCDTCRHTSGVFFTSYCPVLKPANSSVNSLSAYTSSPGTTRYFCKTCGCHLFRSRQSTHADDDDNTLWEVATGTIVNEFEDGQHDGNNNPARPVLEYKRHEHAADTLDGGLSGWLPSILGNPLSGASEARNGKQAEIKDVAQDTLFAASCHCGSINLRIRPPHHGLAASREPHSGFADLLVPFAASDPALVANPEDAKWWLRPSQNSRHEDDLPTRYLAGTCACQSCRLATGFEVQTWAFVPRVNILLPDGSPIDFNTANTNPGTQNLSSYRSSPGVDRNFCSRCGATVFWHDAWRPHLIDVSAGLFRSHTASRLESLLDWCTSRVSFAEEATRGRGLLSAQRGDALIKALGTGMQGHARG